MRIVIVGGAFLLLSITGFTQNDVEILRNRFSFNLFSYLQRPVVADENDYYPIFLHGLIYTRQLTLHGFARARFDFFYKNIDHSNKDEQYTDVHNYSDISLGAGYVHGFGVKRVIPYVAADMLFTSAKIFSETGGQDAGVYQKIQVQDMGISLLPALGIRIQVSRVVSFSLETNCELGYSHEKGTDFTWTTDGIPLKKPVSKALFISRWNPVSLVAFSLSF